jgi:NADPH:quinone reductase-like Zn-dependent oxidoreductase
MRAAVVNQPGPPEVLVVRDVPLPAPRHGWTLVQIKAFGLNRSELMTRQGHSPNVRFPRVLGIECVGVVAESLEPRLEPGSTVAAVMGEMGRDFDGGYAEYALLPDELLMPISTSLPWETLAALPETYLTAYGSLQALGVRDAHGVLLVRGGSSSVGMAAVSLARSRGVATVATTRSEDKASALRAAGSDHVVVDTGGDLANEVRRICPDGPDYILDLIGAPTLAESLALARSGGTVCMTGMLSGIWSIPNFEPVEMIPSGTKLTAFHSKDLRGAAGANALQQITDGVEQGHFQPNVDRVFRLDDIAGAHRYMEANRATGKVVGLP